MREAPGSVQLAEPELPAPELLPELALVIEPESRSRVFLQNLRDLFRKNESTPLHTDPKPAAFRPDVFIEGELPWRRFLQSGACHVLALAAILAGSRFLALQPRATARPVFTHADLVYDAPSQYLPPLDTRRSNPTHARQADAEYSAQPIISLPPEANNRSQTIVTPPGIQLQHEVALPNVVSLLEKIPSNPRMPIGPAPAVPASEIHRLAPRMERSIIAPAPDLQAASQRTSLSPQPAVIAPPPAMEARDARRLGDLNIGHSSVIAPAPQLSLDEQHALPGRSSATLRSAQGRAPQVIAPPPFLAASGHARSGGGMIALNLHPAPGAPPDPPAGSRRGTFAATPEGHHGASGTPAGSGKEDGNGSSGTRNNGKLPSGMYVGKAPNGTTSPVAGDSATKTSSGYAVNPNLIAGMRSPRLSERTTQLESGSKLSSEERAVFGNRKFYSLSLNMPNLNSAAGSWIIRFAALKPDASSGDLPSRAAASGDALSAGASAADLTAPSATRKIDPAYPLELMRQNVAGTVILYGVIHADGKVGSVRVLRSVDPRLDQFASEAIAKWQFQPATKNGAPVEVEATFSIPFRPVKATSNF
jgi:TonB family protein